jgi:hypothetical protein
MPAWETLYQSFPKDFSDASVPVDGKVSFRTGAFLQHETRNAFLALKELAENRYEPWPEAAHLDALGVERGMTRVAELYANVAYNDVQLFMDLRALLRECNGAYPPPDFPALVCRECGQRSLENDPHPCMEPCLPLCYQALGYIDSVSELCNSGNLGGEYCGRSWCSEHNGVRVGHNSEITFEPAPQDAGLDQLYWMTTRLRDLRARAQQGEVGAQTKTLFESLPAWTWEPHTWHGKPQTLRFTGECGKQY